MLISILIMMAFLSFILFKFNVINFKKSSKLLLTGLSLALTITLLAGCSDVNQMKTKKNEGSSQVEQNATNNESAPSTNTTNNNESTTTNNSTNLKESTIHFIDTGNSDAILIKGEKNILIDGADNDDEKFLVDYLKKQGVNALDYIIATHPDADHVGALDAVIKNIDVKNLLVANGSKDTKTYKDFINATSDKGLAPSVPLDGKKFDLGNNSYMMLYNTNGGSDANEQSLVTFYVNGNDKMLFMGDAGKETEHEILDQLSDVDLIKIGHHGSRTSTTPELLNKINPVFAVITVGKDNSYGHPHIETMEKLKNKNLKLHRTDQCGTVIFNSTGNGLKTDCKEGNFEAGTKISNKIESNNNNTSDSNKKTEATTNNNNTSNSNKKTETTTNNTTPNKNESSPTVGKSVYLSATGDKYHSINNCGRMNPSKARKVLLDSIKGQYEPCSKCN